MALFSFLSRTPRATPVSLKGSGIRATLPRRWSVVEKADGLWTARADGATVTAEVTVTARAAAVGDTLPALATTLEEDFFRTTRFEVLTRLDLTMFGEPAFRMEGVFYDSDGEMRSEARGVTLTTEATGARVLNVVASCSGELAEVHADDMLAIMDSLKFSR